jgi:hypothetical protein
MANPKQETASVSANELATILKQGPLYIVAKKSVKENVFGTFALNVVFTTILFLVIFVAGTAWTLAVNKQIEGKPYWETNKYWWYAGGVTFGAIALAIGFGAIAEALKGTTININISSLITGGGEV